MLLKKLIEKCTFSPKNQENKQQNISLLNFFCFFASGIAS
jgi:hypothetical protein